MILKRKKTERDDQIVRMTLAGVEAAVIAAQMELHVATVYDVLRARSLKRIFCTADERRQIEIARASAAASR